MKIRIATPADILVARGLSGQYKEEFEFPDLNHVEAAVVVVNDEDEVIGFAALRNILEAIMLVSGTKNERAKMTHDLLEIARFMSRRMGHNGIHAFVQDKKFEDILKKHFEFRNTKGVSLYKDT